MAPRTLHEWSMCILAAILLICVFLIALNLLSSREREEYTTETGLHCVRVDETLTCEWEEYLKKLRADQYEELKILKY